MYIANYLCENYGKDQQVGFHVHHPVYMCAQVTCDLLFMQVTKLLDGLEFMFIPFVNPDVYAVITSVHWRQVN